MSVLFADSFDAYAVTADLVKKHASNSGSGITFGATVGRNGGGGIQIAPSSTSFLNQPIFNNGAGSSSKLFGEAFWFKCASIPTLAWSFRTLLFITGTSFATFRINTGGAANIIASGGAGPTGTKNICDGQWHWVEWKIDNTTTTATIRCVIDGVGDINSTASAAIPTLNLGSVQIAASAGQSANAFVDDVICYDDAAGLTGDLTITSSFPLGPMQFTTVKPQADSVVSFATVTGGGTHFSQVNETVADGDSTYVESSSSGDQDLYDFAAMGIAPATIKTVIANAYVKNPNPGTIQFQQIGKSGSTQTNGSSVTVPSAYVTEQQSFPQDPNTGAAWASASAVDAATFGVKVV